MSFLACKEGRFNQKDLTIIPDNSMEFSASDLSHSSPVATTALPASAATPHEPGATLAAVSLAEQESYSSDEYDEDGDDEVQDGIGDAESNNREKTSRTFSQKSFPTIFSFSYLRVL
jgi:hypothetical protein